MATTPKTGDATKEIIGMTMQGIEDYTNDFDEHSESSKEIEISMSHKHSIIRHSFGGILSLQSITSIGSVHGSVKPALPLTPCDMIAAYNESDYEIDARSDEDRNIDHKIEENDIGDLFEEVKNIVKAQQMKETHKTDNSVSTEFDSALTHAQTVRLHHSADIPNNARSLHSKQLSVLELDESDEEGSHGSSDSGSTNSEYSDTHTSDSQSQTESAWDSDTHSTHSKSSSPWGTDPEAFDEGVMTYFVLTQKPDPNATKFAMTPFQSIVDEAHGKLKIKYDKITYPSGSKFHSTDLLETEDYHRLQNIQLVRWIKSDSDERAEVKNNPHDCEDLSISDWLKKRINEVYLYYRARDADGLHNCFLKIDDIFADFVGDNWRLKIRPEQTNDYQLFKLFQLLLHTFARLASRLSHINRRIEQSFYECLKLTQKIFPRFRVHLELLKETHKAHIDRENATHCMRSFVTIYYNTQNCDYESDTPQFELCVKALVALDLYMENYSPLNHSILSDRAAYDLNSESFKWLDSYNKYNNIYDDEDNEEYQIIFNECDELTIELCSNPQSRIDKLTDKYEQFRGFSFLRASVSWVIGHSKLYHQRMFFESEKYFFESLYCLKTLTKHEFFPLNRTMHTELASLVLIDYADVLLENKKYSYAIVALEKVIECLQQRGKYDRRFQIIRKLCITCTEMGDYHRAIKYHNITLKKLNDRILNLNEFVYLSQQISTIHLKLGSFAQSEKEIQNGIKTIYLNVLSYRSDDTVNENMYNLDNISIEKIFKPCEGEERQSIGALILELANLYISGGNYLDQAISLLEYLKKKVFTGNAEARRLLILFQLARAYFKNGMYQIADDIMEKRILSNYSSKNKELLTSLEFTQLRVLIMLNCARDTKLQSALRLLDDAMKLERKESFVKKAKINYLKGRVLQHRCFIKLIKKYEQQKQSVRAAEKRQSRRSAKIIITKPITEVGKEDTRTIIGRLTEEKYSAQTLVDASNTIYSRMPVSPQTKPKHRRGGHGGGVVDFSDAGDSAQKEVNPLDAISALLVSHGLYKSIDPIMQAKCCLELSKTYLEIIMEYYALPKFVLRDTKCSEPILKWLGVKIFNDDRTPNNEVIQHCLDDIYRPLYTALTLSKSESKDIALLIESYIALAEYEFLKGANLGSDQMEIASQTSKNFWQQSRIAFFSTFKDSDDWMFLRRIDRHSRLQIWALFKRILRLLICYDNQFIADNVAFFVSYIALETFMIAQKDIIVDNKPKKKNNCSNLIGFDSTVPPNMSPRKGRTRSRSRSKGNIKQNHVNLSPNGANFERYNSRAFYRSDSEKLEKIKNYKKTRGNNHSKDGISIIEEKKDEIIKNPTVTFRIDDDQTEGLAQLQLAADISTIRPLCQRYANYEKTEMKQNVKFNKKTKEVGGEKCLDELFRMHWKMRTESNMFSGGRSTKIDNDKSLVSITKCISALNVSLDRSSTLNRKHRCWKANETFIISLDSLVFVFHPHTLFKFGIHKKRNEKPNYAVLKQFTNVLTNIAFHDADYLKLEDNPWINKQNSNVSLKNLLDKNEKKRIRNGMRNANKKKHNLSAQKEALLRNELSLPHLKLESVKELLMCLDPQNILNLLGAMFSECQIIIISKERCRCLAIIDALFVLMYPFAWQYMCIPWLSCYCFELLNLHIPYLFGMANIKELNNIISNNKYDICDRAVIVDLDTNNVMKPRNDEMKPTHLPMKIKSKLTRAMFRVMSGLLKNAFQINKGKAQQMHWVFPPRRRDNLNIHNQSGLNILNEYRLLSSPVTAPISYCSERKQWYNGSGSDHVLAQNESLIIHLQKEFSTAWVEVLEQYRLFWVNINSALHKDLKSKSTVRIQKYAHPRYRKFLTELQKTRMFSSFQCIRSLASKELLQKPLFDDLVMRSLKWRQSLYHDIKANTKDQSLQSKMIVSIENSKRRYFINELCTVKFDTKLCILQIKPEKNVNFACLNRSRQNLAAAFEIYLKANVYELESDHVHKLHPYIDPKQVRKYGERYQFRIKHQTDGIFTLNCHSYYELTRWIHILRAHSMDTWSWCLNF